MFVGGESLEQLLPVGDKIAVGEEIGFAYTLYLFPEVLIKHFLEAVLDDVVSGIEGNTTAFGLPASSADHHLTLLLRFCAVGVSVHGGSCFRIGEAGCQDCLLFFKRTLGDTGGGLLRLKRKELKRFNISLRWYMLVDKDIWVACCVTCGVHALRELFHFLKPSLLLVHFEVLIGVCLISEGVVFKEHKYYK
jgi:hypothetical protein